LLGGQPDLHDRRREPAGNAVRTADRLDYREHWHWARNISCRLWQRLAGVGGDKRRSGSLFYSAGRVSRIQCRLVT
jgi:hypothetical protein